MEIVIHFDSQFWSAYISCRTQFKDAVQVSMEQIDTIKRLVAKNSDQMQFVRSAEGIQISYFYPRNTFLQFFLFFKKKLKMLSQMEKWPV